jgi:hypothetical protein
VSLSNKESVNEKIAASERCHYLGLRRGLRAMVRILA